MTASLDVPQGCEASPGSRETAQIDRAYLQSRPLGLRPDRPPNPDPAKAPGASSRRVPSARKLKIVRKRHTSRPESEDGRTARVGLDAAAWEDLPTRLVPPRATPEAASAAMAQAVRADNLAEARQILIDTGTDRDT